MSHLPQPVPAWMLVLWIVCALVMMRCAPEIQQAMNPTESPAD